MFTYLRCAQCFNFFEAETGKAKICSDHCLDLYLDRAIMVPGRRRGAPSAPVSEPAPHSRYLGQDHAITHQHTLVS